MKNVAKFIISVLICEGAGIVGSFFTAPAISTWYASLIKPSFAPPNWVFAPVWTALFFLMGVSLYLVWAKNFKIPVSENKTPAKKAWNPISEKLWSGAWKEENVVAIFSLQLILNILWSALFFGLKMPAAAFAEILMLWAAILYTIVNFYRVSKPAAYLLIPYLVWVALASALNFSIVWLN
jgi:translocator protein